MEDEDYTLGVEDSVNASSIPAAVDGFDESGFSVSHEESQTGNNWVTFVAAVALVFVATLLIKTCAYYICLGRNKILPELGFDHAVSEAKRRTNSSQNPASTSSSSDASTTPIFQCYDGDFYIKYEDGGHTRSGFVKIQLRNNGNNGYEVHGMCADADGYATITDGYVSYSGEGWWVQEILDEDEERVGLKVFSKGQFDFDSKTFAGRWTANTGRKGKYLKFEGTAYQPCPEPTMDIPVAIPVPHRDISLLQKDDAV
ncbi:hypothetical protein ACHAXT_007208 [Thalassiosira profunda]